MNKSIFSNPCDVGYLPPLPLPALFLAHIQNKTKIIHIIANLFTTTVDKQILTFVIFFGEIISRKI